ELDQRRVERVEIMRGVRLAVRQPVEQGGIETDADGEIGLGDAGKADQDQSRDQKSAEVEAEPHHQAEQGCDRQWPRQAIDDRARIKKRCSSGGDVAVRRRCCHCARSIASTIAARASSLSTMRGRAALTMSMASPAFAARPVMASQVATAEALRESP